MRCLVFVKKIWYGSRQQICCYGGYNVNRSEVWSSHSIFPSRLPWHVFDWNEDQLYLRYSTQFLLNWLTGGRWLQQASWWLTFSQLCGSWHPITIKVAYTLDIITCHYWLSLLASFVFDSLVHVGLRPSSCRNVLCWQLWNYLKKNYTLFSFDCHIWCSLLCLLCNWIAQNTFLLEMHKVCFIPDSTHRIILIINMIELAV